MEYKEAEKIIEYYNQIDADIKTQKKFLQDIDNQYGADPPGDIKQYQEKLQQKIKDICTYRRAIINEINSLDVIEKDIIIKHYFEERIWSNVAVQVNYSIRQCKNIRHRAISKLRFLFENNADIKRIFPEAANR